MVSIYKTYTNTVLLLCLTLLLAQTASAQFTGNDWSQFSIVVDGARVVDAKAVCANELDDDTTNDDIDEDNDGLIELCYLEDVDAMRHDLTGTSLRRGSKTLSAGCGGGADNNECLGYELVRNLDFNDDNSYSSSTNIVKWTVSDYMDNADEGWQPIGDSDNFFNSIFEGNGHTISNLMINRSVTNSVGLFSFTDEDSKISNIGLLNVIIEAKDSASGLVGENSGSIANSYVTGSVKGRNYVGGLTGYLTDGSIANSYATSSVKGKEAVGGLVGENDSSIKNSYATGLVDGETFVGGLTSYNSGSIENSYATNPFITTMGLRVGGLVGQNGGSIEDSYWDTVTSTISDSGDGTGQTDTALKEPTTATGIYSMWGTDDWDFGNRDQYPVLKYAAGDDTKYSACRESQDQSQQPVCGTLLRGQRNNQPRIISPTTTTKITITSDDSGTIKILVKVSDDDVNDELTLLLSAEENQTLVILEIAKAVVLTNGNPDRVTNEDLSIRAAQGMFGMTELSLVAMDNSGLDNAMSEPVVFKVSVVSNTPPAITPIPSPIILPLGTSTALNVVIEDTDSETLSVQLASSNLTVATATIVAINDTNYTLKITGSSTGTAVITVTASDDKGASTKEMFTIKVDAEPTGTVTISPNNTDKWLLEATSNVTDANGIAETNYQWLRVNTEGDNTVVGTDPNTFRIPENGRRGGTKYRLDVTIVDNIEQLVTTSSNVYTVENEAPMIRSVTPERSVYNEGDSVLVTTKASDANRDVLTYTLSVNQGARIINEFNRVSGGATLSFEVPANWIEDTRTGIEVTEPLQLEVTVSDGSETTKQTVTVNVTKVDNDTVVKPSISVLDPNKPYEFTLGQINPALDPDGGNNNSDLKYQWQYCMANTDCSSWQNIGMLTTDGSLTVPDSPENLRVEDNQFRVQILYTDGQGYRREDFFSATKTYRADPDIRVRAKVFLEGPLQ